MTLTAPALCGRDHSVILVAIQLEERDLMHAHPEYTVYRRRVPMLVPAWRHPPDGRRAPRTSVAETVMTSSMIALLFATLLVVPAGVRAVASFAVKAVARPRPATGRHSGCGSERKRPNASRRFAAATSQGGRVESWQRGKHPVFVFSSLPCPAAVPTTPADFALDALNHPAATTTSARRSRLSSRCSNRTTSANVRAASIARDMAATGRQPSPRT